jgi:fructuronate reductase
MLVRSPTGDAPTTIDALVAVHDGADEDAWREYFRRPEVGVATLTVTEAGYRRASAGGLDLRDPEVVGDLRRLRAGDGAVTAPGRLVDGLRARRSAGTGPIAIVSLDNLPDNGRVARQVTLELAAAIDRSLARWIEQHVAFVSTMVDRITPATTEADRAVVRSLTGREDRSPVVTEPFSEWVVEGEFPAGRPRWEAAGARFVDDLEPYERRKLWLLNGGHSLLAYAGLARGFTTVAEAFAEPQCRAELEQLWSEAADVLTLPADEATAALRDRFANARIEHRLAQIAQDGSAKLPVRVLAVAQARAAAGLPVGRAGAGVVAAWIDHLDPSGADPRAADLGLRLRGLGSSARALLVLDAIAPRLARKDVFARHVAERLAVRRPVRPTQSRPTQA